MLVATGAGAADLVARQAQSSGLRYVIGVPSSAPRQPMPLLVWLHGYSLRGTDLDALKSGYGPLGAWPLAGTAPHAILAPQLPKSAWFWRKTDVLNLIDEVAAAYPIDRTRIVLIGASLGAAGIWDAAAERPGQFRALISVAGTGSEQDVRRAGICYARFFHGRDDTQVALSRVSRSVQLLKAQGADVELTVLDGVGHEPQAFEASAFLNGSLLQAAFGLPAAESPSPGADSTPQDSGGAPRGSRADQLMVWIDGLSRLAHRRAGTPEGLQGEAWVMEQFRRIGYEPQRDTFPVQVWQPGAASLSLDGAAVLAVTPVANAAFTAAAGVRAPLVFAGSGSNSDFRRIAARGKIAVIDASVQASGTPLDTTGAHWVSDPLRHFDGPVWEAHFPSNVLGAFVPTRDEDGAPDGLVGSLAARRDALRNAREAGAVGLVVLLPNACGVDATMYWPYDSTPGALPAAYVSARSADAVRAAAQRGSAATLRLTGTLTAGTTANIWAVLPGASEDIVLVTSHHDSVSRGAVEDASGVAQVLAQAQRWRALPISQRPRTMVFVAAAGHFYCGQGAAEFARRHPELMDRVRGVVTVEHTPAREAQPSATGWSLTGKPQRSTIFVPKRRDAIDRITKAVSRAPQPSLTVESPLFDAPLTDAAGYVSVMRERGKRLDYASWIAAPCYLITAADTPAMIDTPRLESVAQTVDALVDAFVADRPW